MDASTGSLSESDEKAELLQEALSCVRESYVYRFSQTPDAADEEAADEVARDEEAPDKEAPHGEASDGEASDKETPDNEAPDEGAPDEVSYDDNDYPELGAEKSKRGRSNLRGSVPTVEHELKYSRTDIDRVFIAVLSRNRMLGGYIKQLVRVIRLASIISGNRPFEQFFFAASARMTASHFEHVIGQALHNNRILAGVIRLGEDESDGPSGRRKTRTIEFIEAGMAGAEADDGKTAPFKIYYDNIPPVAALFEIIWYVLGSDPLKKTLQHALGSELPAGNVGEDISKALRSEFEAWLNDAIGTSVASRHAASIRGFLAERNILKVGLMDDETIFSFWARHSGSEDEDITRFRHIATSMLRFERALGLRMSQRQEEAIDQQNTGADVEETDQDPADQFETRAPNTSDWKSPMIGLLSPPCSDVKWLASQKQLKFLNNYLDGCANEEEPRAGASADHSDANPRAINETSKRTVADINIYAKLDALDAKSGALMGIDRFDFRFIRTLLRADVFAPVQNRIIQAARDQKPIEKEMPHDAKDGYAIVETGYAEIRDELVESAIASIGHFAMRHARQADLGPLSRKAILSILALIHCVSSETVFRYFRFGAPQSEGTASSSAAAFEQIEAKVRSALAVLSRAGRAALPQSSSFVRPVDRDRFRDDVNRFRNQVDRFRETHPGVGGNDPKPAEKTAARFAMLTELNDINNAFRRIRQAQPTAFAAEYAEFARIFGEIHEGIFDLVVGTHVRAALAVIQNEEGTGIPDVDAFMGRVAAFIRKVKAHDKNGRTGFKAGDVLNQNIRRAHTQGAKHLVLLIAEIDRLAEALKASSSNPDWFPTDREKFSRQFNQIYAG